MPSHLPSFEYYSLSGFICGTCDGFQCYMGDMCDVTYQYRQQTNNDVLGHVGCVNEAKHIRWSYKEVDKK